MDRLIYYSMFKNEVNHYFRKDFNSFFISLITADLSNYINIKLYIYNIIIVTYLLLSILDDAYYNQNNKIVCSQY